MWNDHQFLSSIEKDAHKRKLVLFFCHTVYMNLYSHYKICSHGYSVTITYRCQLSLIDPRDEIVLQTKLDDYCDKLVDERWSSEVLST